MLKQCGLLAVLATLLLFGGARMSDAQAQPEKFGLLRVETPAVRFDLAGESLDFATAAPERFIWNDSSDVPPEFAKAGLFESLEQVRIGYDPLERDRYEVRIYRATLFTDRIALAADYASLLARAWGRTNFGVAPHGPAFGEVLGGDDASGIMLINRISVFRRGDELLILRQIFHADRFEAYADDLARMVGSVRFDQRADTDLVRPDAQPTALPSTPPFRTHLPANWARVGDPINEGPRGTFEFWNDTASAGGNLGLMLASIPAQSDWSGPSETPPELPALGNTAGAFANVTLENLLPGTPFTLSPVEATRFGQFAEITAFNGLYTFKVEIGEDEPRTQAKLNVLLTYGLDGQMLVTSLISPLPRDLYAAGTDMHGTYVQAMQLEALTDHFTEIAGN